MRGYPSIWRGLTLGAALSACAGPAAASCGLTLENLAGWTAALAPFDPFSGVGIRESGHIRITNGTGADCSNVRLTLEDLSDPGLLAGTSETIPFKITTHEGSTQLIGDGTPFVDVGTVPANTTVTVDIDYVIDPASSVIAPGTFSCTDLTVKLASDSGATAETTKTLTVSTHVDELLDINIGNTSYIPGSLAAYTMNLGTLTDSTSESVGVTIRSNVDHRVTVTSENDGVMKGPSPGADDSHQVSYTASLGGSNLQLAPTGTDTISLGSKTGINGTLRAFKVQIYDISAARAGSYRDVITLTLESGL